MPTLATNARATHDFLLLEKFEGGLVLTGPEVKSAKAGSVNLKGAFLHVRGNELVIVGMHIAPYAPAGKADVTKPTRDRVVLVHKKEIDKLRSKSEAERLTIVPVSVYTAKNLVKLSFALARGKKQFEKRDAIKKRDVEREIRRRMQD